MKKYTLQLFTLIGILSTLTSCYYIDDYNENYSERPTNFNDDISKITQFYLSNPIEIKITNENLVNDTLVYQVGDTIKLELSFDAIYEDKPDERYDLYKSTNATTFSTYLNKYTYVHPDFEYLDRYFIDLNYLEDYPHLKNLSRDEILNSTYYDLYTYGSIIAHYNFENKKYEASVGIVTKRQTGTDDITGNKHTVKYYLSEYISSDYSYYDDENSYVNISIPTFSTFENKNIVIE